SFERIFNMDIKVEKNRIYHIDEILSNEEIIELKYVFDKVNENGKYSIEKSIHNLDLYFNVEIYGVKENEFHIRLNKISKGNMKLSYMLKNFPGLSWIKDRNGVYVDVNYTYANYFNTTPQDMIGKTDYDIWKKEEADKFKKEDEYVVKENKLCNYEEFVYINNKKVYLETSKWPYRYENNEFILGSIGVALITNDKVELKNNIDRNEEMFKEIANNIEEIIMIRDEKKALYVSPSFEKIYGVTPEELNIYEDINNWYDYWDNIEFESTPKGYECKEPSKDVFRVSKEGKEDIWMCSSFVPVLDENGNTIKKVGILSNITDTKKIQEELDNMKMEFFANISHELRTPINLIFSSLQVLYKKLDNLDEDEIRFFDRYLSIINQNGLRLLKLVNNLIDTTRLDSGQLDYNPRNNNIISCVENICMSVCDFIENNNINIIFDTNEEEKIIAFDQDNMERIILNLLSNAIKFNKPGGLIEVNINCDKEVEIRVKDSGIGIPQDKLESVFGRFEQVKSKFKKEREGSGIGLSLVKSLVHMHGGEIRAESKLGEGTEFIITLPDALIDEIEVGANECSKYLSDVNRMTVEFSDIYA
ncbi:MAG: PAS domain-containing sensor histidine kinase, partial [Peptostreptococcaceae bacterium]